MLVKLAPGQGPMTRVGRRITFTLKPGEVKDLPASEIMDLLEGKKLVKGEFPMLVNNETGVFDGKQVVSLKTFVQRTKRGERKK